VSRELEKKLRSHVEALVKDGVSVRRAMQSLELAHQAYLEGLKKGFGHGDAALEQFGDRVVQALTESGK
jgi:hypothetical protein